MEHHSDRHRLSRLPSSRGYGPYIQPESEPRIFNASELHSPSSQNMGAGLSGPITGIGLPMYFSAGQFAGQTLRAELEELQKAESGRKYARVDRRPLDPPPAVLLRLFRVDRVNCTEHEIPYEEVQNLGIMCTVDLFPVPESGEQYGLKSRDGPRGESSQHLNQHVAHSNSYHGLHEGLDVDRRSPRNQLGASLTYFPTHPFSFPDTSSYSNQNGHNGFNVGSPPHSPFQLPRRRPLLRTLSPGAPLPTDVVHRVGNHLITESSRFTPALVGEKVVEPVLVERFGRRAFVFVFVDLAVQREGTFIFRYRTFDIFATVPGQGPSMSDHPVLAEVYGGPFKVYSTREFPGLEPSTELTKSLSKYGVRVVLREAERKSRKRTRPPVASQSQSDSQSYSSEVSELRQSSVDATCGGHARFDVDIYEDTGAYDRM